MVYKLKDDKLKFFPVSHKYKVGKRELTSVTTFIGQFFEPFNAREIARKLAKFPVNKKAKKGVRYFLKEWKDATEQGTTIHKYLEMAINYPKGLIRMMLEDDSIKLIKAYWGYKYIKSLKGDMKPEIQIYSERYGLAGTIDLMVCDDGEITLFDWKTNKAIRTSGYEGKRGSNPITQDIEDCNFNKYSLQLNLYAFILKEEYGIKVSKMRLVHLTDEEAIEYVVKFNFKKIREMIEYGKEE